VRTGRRTRHGEPGQAADQPVGVAMFHQPGVGVRRRQLLAAGPGTRTSGA
jgi:hypothetical protein